LIIFFIISDHHNTVLIIILFFLFFSFLEYGNPGIQSTSPAINSVIPVDLNNISITYDQPAAISGKNITIYQKENGMSLLRQRIPGNEIRDVQYSDDHRTISFNVFPSTFNQAETDYFVIVDDDAVKSLESNQPLLGVEENVWRFTTGM
jgi:hypothetical protein